MNIVRQGNGIFYLFSSFAHAPFSAVLDLTLL